MPLKPQISLTYEIVTPESAAEGDTAENGFTSGTGFDYPIPDMDGWAGEARQRWFTENALPCWEADPEDESSAAEQAIKFLRDNGYSEPSSGHLSEHAQPGVWYSWSDSEPNYQNGEDRRQSAHLQGFTPEEEIEIYRAIVKR